MNILIKLIAASVAALGSLPAGTAAMGTPTPSILASGTATFTSGIGGIGYDDQFGNPWVKAEDAKNGKALVSIFDCAGKPRIVGEEPSRSIGSGNDFAGFRPYANATWNDLDAIYRYKDWERRCLVIAKSGVACEPNPTRHDCRIVEVPVPNYSSIISSEAAKAYEAAHPTPKK